MKLVQNCTQEAKENIITIIDFTIGGMVTFSIIKEIMAIHDLTDTITIIIEIEEIHITIIIIVDTITNLSKEHLIITDQGYQIIEILAMMQLVSSRERVAQRNL